MTCVQIVTVTETDPPVLNFIAFCSSCHQELGRFDADEIAAMIIDAPLGEVLCYDCEFNRLWAMITQRDTRRFRRDVWLLATAHGFI